MTSPSTPRLWAGLLLAPLAWLSGELVGYLLSARNCPSDRSIVPLHAVGSPRTIDGAIVVVAVVVAAVGLVIALGNWRATRSHRRSSADIVSGRAHFMAYASVIGSSVVLFGILLFGFAMVVVDACRVTR